MKLELIAAEIFEKLSRDISDRRGLKYEWEQIDEEIINEELRPAWERIIKKVIRKYYSDV